MPQWIDISSPICPNEVKSQPFGLPNATAIPVNFQANEKSVETIDSFYCDEIKLCVHGNGTHTETSGHIRVDSMPRIYMTERYPPVIMMALLITVSARKWIDDNGVLIKDLYEAIHDVELDWIINQEEIRQKLHEIWPSKPLIGEKSVTFMISDQMALIVRVRSAPNAPSFPYWTESAVELLITMGFQHLLIDTPSLDREKDGGKLRSHRKFFGKNLQESYSTLTELCRVSEDVEDGWYWLNLQCAPLRSDAVPSRPMILRIE